jgi:hypothetical protein
MDSPYKSNFREELIATAMLMGLVITGSFVLAYRSINQPKQPDLSLDSEADVLGTTKTIEGEVNEVINELMTPAPTPIPRPTLKPIASSSAAQTPQYNTTIIEQPYGQGGEYDNDWYRLTVSNPRLIVSTSRTFKVDIVLANKTVELGLKNRLSATIIKDGQVIAESAPFSLSEVATAYPGEQISFTATMSLISGTDVARIKYLPLTDSVVDTIHDL